MVDRHEITVGIHARPGALLIDARRVWTSLNISRTAWLKDRIVVITLAGALAELIGQTIARVPWMQWSGSISPAQLHYLCSSVHAVYGGRAGESSLCHQAAAAMYLAPVLNVTGVVLLVIAAVRWYRGHRQARAESAST